MSTIYGWDDNEVIEIPFPKERVKKYLRKLKTSSWKNITIEQKEKIFLWAIADFKKGNLALDELSDIAGNMWSSLPSDRSGDLADALYKCGEFNFYVRHITKKNPGNFVWFMSDVMDFYKKRNTK